MLFYQINAIKHLIEFIIIISKNVLHAFTFIKWLGG